MNYDARQAPPLATELQPNADENVKGLSLSVYANGRLVPVDDYEIKTEGISATIIFKTTVNALMVGMDASPRIERMWGGLKTDDVKMVRQPSKTPGKQLPQAGTIKVIDIVIPAKESDEVLVKVKAMTDIWDWLNEEGDQLASAGDIITIPRSWIEV